MADLSYMDLKTIAEYLLYRMDIETRTQMMADLPTVYARAFPNVAPSVITGEVLAAIVKDRSK